ncbi:MAG: hypothetical protein LBS17_05555 [Actinomycetes bacterium]|jgi:DNA-binding SARP family transcriptional activator|nr:hypothetical protein [Actinomycetes bacterium]
MTTVLTRSHSTSREICEALNVPADAPASAMLVRLAQLATDQIRNHAHAEATISLDTALQLVRASGQSTAEAALLRRRILCHLALSNTDSLMTDYEQLVRITRTAGVTVDELPLAESLLGARVFESCGKTDDALNMALNALDRCSNSAEFALCQTIACRFDLAISGDAHGVVECLLPLAAAITGTTAGTADLGSIAPRTAQRMLKATLAYACLCIGRPRRAESFIEDIDHPASLADIEMLVTHALHAIAVGDFSRAARLCRIALAADSGASRGECSEVLYKSCLILQATGQRREAKVVAEELSEVTLTVSAHRATAGHAPDVRADLMLASCCLQRAGLKRAQALLQDVAAVIDNAASTCPRERQAQVLLSAVLDAACGDMQSALARLHRHISVVLSRDLILYAALYCYIHPPLFGLLCQAYGIEALPLEMTDLLDSWQFHGTFNRVVDALGCDQSAGLDARFEHIGGDGATNVTAPREILEVDLLGGLRMRVNGRALDLSTWRNSRARALLIALAVHRGDEVSRDWLMNLFWPDKTGEALCNNFYVTWAGMKKLIVRTLPAGLLHLADEIKAAFHNYGGRCALLPSYCRIDLRTFTDALNRAAVLITSGERDEALSLYRTAADLYHGDVLPGDRRFEWLDYPRNRYHKQFLDAMSTAAELALQAHAPELALHFTDRALAVSREREGLYKLAMQAYAMADRRQEAMETYHDCKRYLSRELGLDPGHSIQAVYDKLLSDG